MSKERDIMKSFEEEYAQLQEIVDKLDQGNMDLEKSIGQFKTGMELLKSLRKQLSKVENELKVLDVNISDREE
ncbi:MAG: exodeoxyribonuclease VII small subunit [Patescibacteria group bacterium]